MANQSTLELDCLTSSSATMMSGRFGLPQLGDRPTVGHRRTGDERARKFCWSRRPCFLRERGLGYQGNSVEPMGPGGLFKRLFMPCGDNPNPQNRDIHQRDNLGG